MVLWLYDIFVFSIFVLFLPDMLDILCLSEIIRCLKSAQNIWIKVRIIYSCQKQKSVHGNSCALFFQVCFADSGQRHSTLQDGLLWPWWTISQTDAFGQISAYVASTCRWGKLLWNWTPCVSPFLLSLQCSRLAQLQRSLYYFQFKAVKLKLMICLSYDSLV